MHTLSESFELAEESELVKHVDVNGFVVYDFALLQLVKDFGVGYSRGSDDLWVAGSFKGVLDFGLQERKRRRGREKEKKRKRVSWRIKTEV